MSNKSSYPVEGPTKQNTNKSAKNLPLDYVINVEIDSAIKINRIKSLVRVAKDQGHTLKFLNLGIRKEDRKSRIIQFATNEYTSLYAIGEFMGMLNYHHLENKKRSK